MRIIFRILGKCCSLTKNMVLNLPLENVKCLYLDEHGLLFRKTATRHQLVLSRKYHELIFKELHKDMGHLGAEQVLNLIRDQFYWHRMQKQVEHYVTSLQLLEKQTSEQGDQSSSD